MDRSYDNNLWTIEHPRMKRLVVALDNIFENNLQASDKEWAHISNLSRQLFEAVFTPVGSKPMPYQDESLIHIPFAYSHWIKLDVTGRGRSCRHTSEESLQHSETYHQFCERMHQLAVTMNCMRHILEKHEPSCMSNPPTDPSNTTNAPATTAWRSLLTPHRSVGMDPTVNIPRTFAVPMPLPSAVKIGTAKRRLEPTQPHEWLFGQGDWARGLSFGERIANVILYEIKLVDTVRVARAYMVAYSWLLNCCFSYYHQICTEWSEQNATLEPDRHSWMGTLTECCLWMLTDPQVPGCFILTDVAPQPAPEGLTCADITWSEASSWYGIVDEPFRPNLMKCTENVYFLTKISPSNKLVKEAVVQVLKKKLVQLSASTFPSYACLKGMCLLSMVAPQIFAPAFCEKLAQLMQRIVSQPSRWLTSYLFFCMTTLVHTITVVMFSHGFMAVDLKPLTVLSLMLEPVIASEAVMVQCASAKFLERYSLVPVMRSLLCMFPSETTELMARYFSKRTFPLSAKDAATNDKLVKLQRGIVRRLTLSCQTALQFTHSRLTNHGMAICDENRDQPCPVCLSQSTATMSDDPKTNTAIHPFDVASMVDVSTRDNSPFGAIMAQSLERIQPAKTNEILKQQEECWRKFSDVEVVCQDVRFLCHRNMVCHKSRIFASSINGLFQESINKSVDLSMYKPFAVHVALDWMYSSHFIFQICRKAHAEVEFTPKTQTIFPREKQFKPVYLSVDQALEVLQVADYLGLQDLIQSLFYRLSHFNVMDNDTVIPILQVSMHFSRLGIENASHLFRLCQIFVCQRGHLFLETAWLTSALMTMEHYITCVSTPDYGDDRINAVDELLTVSFS